MKFIRKEFPFAVMVLSAVMLLSSCGAGSQRQETRLEGSDWAQFLGPNRNSTSPQTGLLRSWPENGPEILWEVEVGRGFGAPVVKNGRVYLLDRDDEYGDIMRCFDIRTGEELWQFAFNSPGVHPFPGSRTIPLVDDRHVYAVGANGDLLCIDINTQQLVWQRNLWTEFGGTALPVWGVSNSPVIYGDFLIAVTASHTHQLVGLVALNKNTGETVWHAQELGNETYVSPKIINIHGQNQVVFTTSMTNVSRYSDVPFTLGNVLGLNPNTGEVLWQWSEFACRIAIPCATDAGNNKLLITGGYDQGATMLQINRNADGAFYTDVVFTTMDFEDQTKSPLFHDGYFYGMFRTNTRREGLVAMNMAGEIMWRTGRNPDFERGSMILADGLILATDGMSMLYLIEPSPEEFRMISSVELPFEGMQNWAPLALANGILLVRDQEKMIALKVTE